MRSRSWLHRTVLAGVFGVCAIIAATRDAAAQLEPEPDQQVENRARFRWGSLYIHPTFAITDLGTDSNVFNDAAEPKEDLTATMRSLLQAGYRVGRVRLTGFTGADYVYFWKFRDEQSVNRRSGGRVELDIEHLVPFASVDYRITKERPGFEIDQRARRAEPIYTYGANVRLGIRTTLQIRREQTTVRFNADERYRTVLSDEVVFLSEQLNRRGEATSAALRLQLTPFTTWLVRGELSRLTFDTASERNSETRVYSTGLEFSPAALLTGTAVVGYRDSKPEGPEAPRYDGVTGAVALTYTILGKARVGIQAEREVGYSVEDVSPYYIGTGGGLMITQHIAGPVEVVATGRRQRLKYQRGAIPFPDYVPLPEGLISLERADTVDILGGGIGFRLGAARLGINYEYSRRRTDILARRYQRSRIYGSLSYGFPALQGR